MDKRVLYEITYHWTKGPIGGYNTFQIVAERMLCSSHLSYLELRIQEGELDPNGPNDAESVTITSMQRLG